MKHEVIIAVGANIEPEKHVRESIDILKKEQGFIGSSTFLWTDPVGFQDQPKFYNGAFLIETDLDYRELNAYLKDVEKRLGRVKSAIKSGPRTIDLDITIFDGQVVHDDYYEKDYTYIPVDELIDEYHVAVIDDGEDLLAAGI